MTRQQAGRQQTDGPPSAAAGAHFLGSSAEERARMDQKRPNISLKSSSCKRIEWTCFGVVQLRAGMPFAAAAAAAAGVGPAACLAEEAAQHGQPTLQTAPGCRRPLAPASSAAGSELRRLQVTFAWFDWLAAATRLGRRHSRSTRSLLTLVLHIRPATPPSRRPPATHGSTGRRPCG